MEFRKPVVSQSRDGLTVHVLQPVNHGQGRPQHFDSNTVTLTQLGCSAGGSALVVLGNTSIRE